MSKLRVIAAFVAVAGAVMALPAIGAEWEEQIKTEPGYVDFGNLQGLTDTEPKVAVSLGGPLLTFLREATREEEPELAGMLDGLKGVRVSVYPLNGDDTEAIKERVKSLADELAGAAWERTVKVEDDSDLVHMYLKMQQDSIAGLTLMVVEPGSEAVFINVIGSIDPAALGRLVSKFGVSVDFGGALSKIKKQAEEAENGAGEQAQGNDQSG